MNTADAKRGMSETKKRTKPMPEQDDDEMDHAAGKARLAELYAVGGKPKTVLHSAYRGRK